MKKCPYCNEPFGFFDRLTKAHICAKCFKDPSVSKRIEEEAEKRKYHYRKLSLPEQGAITEVDLYAPIKDTLIKIRSKTRSVGTSIDAMSVNMHLQSNMDVYLNIYESEDGLNFTASMGPTGKNTVEGLIIDDSNRTKVYYWLNKGSWFHLELADAPIAKQVKEIFREIIDEIGGQSKRHKA